MDIKLFVILVHIPLTVMLYNSIIQRINQYLPSLNSFYLLDFSIFKHFSFLELESYIAINKNSRNLFIKNAPYPTTVVFNDTTCGCIL